MKKTLIGISVVISLLLTIVVSAFSGSALSLYTDGDYTYVELDDNFVSLHDYHGETGNMVVCDESMGKYVISVYDFAFSENTDIQSIDFSNAKHLNEIGVRAFSECSSINTGIIFPSGLNTLGYAAFQECTALPSVSFNNGLASIPTQCFYGCTSLSEVFIPASVTSIGNQAFANCTQLDDVYIQGYATAIDSTAFSNCNTAVIHCYSNSTAHKFALDYGYNYELYDPPVTYKLGDVNEDGYVNINDVTSIQRYLAELEDFNELQELAADANRDGFVDISDATTIQMFLAEYEIPYPIGETITQ